MIIALYYLSTLTLGYLTLYVFFVNFMIFIFLFIFLGPETLSNRQGRKVWLFQSGNVDEPQPQY